MIRSVYFYDKEAEYEAWLNENQKNGLVVNNLRGKDPKPWKPKEEDGGLRLHKATCSSLNRPRDHGKRTKPFGKLCGFDELLLSQECERISEKAPSRCNRSGQNCFG